MTDVHMTSPDDNHDHDHDNDHRHDTTTRVGALVITLDESLLQQVPARTPTVHWGRYDGRAVGGPTPTPQIYFKVKMQWRNTQTAQHTCLPTNMEAEQVTTNNVDDQPVGAEDCRGTVGADRED